MNVITKQPRETIGIKLNFSEAFKRQGDAISQVVLTLKTLPDNTLVDPLDPEKVKIISQIDTSDRVYVNLAISGGSDGDRYSLSVVAGNGLPGALLRDYEMDFVIIIKDR